jgi:(p)ppGpp synthase/HD superfamily hydrolase
MLSDLNNAIRIATIAHAGQIDKAGKPYILHPLRVGAAGLTEEEQIVGFLHDVVEDTGIMLHELRMDFGNEIADAIDSVTRRENETYKEFILRAAQNPIGKAVKINDIKDNLKRMDGLSSLSEKTGMTRRYHNALVALGEKIDER